MMQFTRATEGPCVGFRPASSIRVDKIGKAIFGRRSHVLFWPLADAPVGNSRGSFRE